MSSVFSNLVLSLTSSFSWDMFLWGLLGAGGQSLFFMRFLVQWLSSERAGYSVMPVAFWYFSMAGGMITLVYTIHLGSVVLSLGQCVGLFVYARNLMLLKGNRAHKGTHAHRGKCTHKRKNDADA